MIPDAGRRGTILAASLTLASVFKPTAAFAEACDLKAAGTLKWCDIKVGKGGFVKNGDSIEMVYQGTAVKSREAFDSSPDDEPLEVVVGEDEVIPGWEKAISGSEDLPPVKYGSVRKVIIPNKLAYGAEGYGCRYDSSKRGGFNCLVDPYEDVEMVFKVLAD